MIAQIPSFVKGNFDKTYEESVNVGSLDDAGCGVGAASLGTEEVDPFISHLHEDFTAVEALAVQTVDNVLVCGDMKLTTLSNVLETLESLDDEITLSEDIMKKARKCLDNMLEAASNK